MTSKALIIALLLIAVFTSTEASAVEDSGRDKLPAGLALLPIRDPLLSSTVRTANDGTRVTIADSNVIVTRTGTADVVRTIEDVVARDRSHDDGALTDEIVGIMGVEAPDAQLKQQIRAALAQHTGSLVDASNASRAFHDRITAIVTASAAASRGELPDGKPPMKKDSTPTPSTDGGQRPDQADPRLQPLMDVLGAVNSLL